MESGPRQAGTVEVSHDDEQIHDGEVGKIEKRGSICTMEGEQQRQL